MPSRIGFIILVVALVLSPALARGQNASQPKSSVPPRQVETRTHWQASGRGGAVSTGGLAAAQAGLEILKQGGNATDAAVAVILALSVTDSRLFCFGGEVPAALDACLSALDRFGTMTFTQVVAPTLKLLDQDPKAWHADLARTLRELSTAETSGQEPAQTGSPDPGVATDRSRGLRLVADAFYRGTIARRIDAWSRANGGLIRYRDLAAHVTRIEDPVAVEYRGFSVYKCGPWTQGPCLLEALQVLEGFNLAPMEHNSAQAMHITVEAMKLGLADRDSFYADPLFEDVPTSALLDPAYALKRRGLIDPEHASLTRRPGDPRAGKALLDPAADPADRRAQTQTATAHDTTTCVVVDRWGNMVAATPSGWSGVLAGDTGVWLGSRLQSFNLWPDHPDVIEPGKRPRITLSPTIVLKGGKPVLGVSVAGGDNQDQMTLQLLLNHLDYHLQPAKSVVAPRFMTEHLISSFLQKPPVLGSLRVNPEIDTAALEALRVRGHKVTVSPGPIGAAPSVISIDSNTGVIQAAGDPRAGRHAVAY